MVTKSALLDLQNFSLISYEMGQMHLEAYTKHTKNQDVCYIMRIRALLHIRKKFEDVYHIFGDPETVVGDDDVFRTWLLLKTYKSLLHISNSALVELDNPFREIVRDECDKIFARLLEKGMY